MSILDSENLKNELWICDIINYWFGGLFTNELNVTI